MLTFKFEEIKMLEDESFNDFYTKLNDIMSFRFNLNKKMKDSRVMRKILWYLPERFRPKATTIEESKDLDSIKVEELVSSLKTFKASLPQMKEAQDDPFDEKANLNNEDLDLIARKFKKFLLSKKAN